jgi:predicted N-acetyltransferase YhbS
MQATTTAQRAVLDLIRRVCDNTDRIEARANGQPIGHILLGCAAVLRAMDEITVSDE